MDLAAALTALDLDPDDPADHGAIGIVLALVDQRDAERQLREIEHPSVTGPWIRRVTYEPPALPVWPGGAR